jgi:hypothetical protein
VPISGTTRFSSEQAFDRIDLTLTENEDAPPLRMARKPGIAGFITPLSLLIAHLP